MEDFEKLLSGGDLRSIGKGHSLISKVQTQSDFDSLFSYLNHSKRLLVMRAADAVEKISLIKPHFLFRHKKRIFELCSSALTKELKWHLALLLPRLGLNNKEFQQAWNILLMWAKDKTSSRILRVNSIQALSELVLAGKEDLIQEFQSTLMELEKENIPSVNARIKKIRKQISG